MITGKLNGKDFTIDGGDVLCADISTKKTVRNVYESVLVGFKTYDGEPEYYVAERLKKIGARNVKYIDENVGKNLIY